MNNFENPVKTGRKQKNADSEKRGREIMRTHISVKTVLTYALILFVVAVYLFPFYWMFLEAFRNSIFVSFPPDLNPLSGTGLHYFISNFSAVWNLGMFPRWYFNSVLVAMVVIFGSVSIAALAGYAFARLNFRGRNVLFYLVLATLMIPFPVVSISSYLFMLKLGWISTYQGLIAPQIASALDVFIMRQYFMTIPKEMEDAAKVDGLSTFQIFYKIGLPMAKPAIAASFIFTFIGSWNNFLWPLMEVQNQGLFTLPLVLNFFKGAGGTQIIWNQMMMAVLLTLIPTLIIYAILERYMVEGISLSGTGSVK